MPFKSKNISTTRWFFLLLAALVIYLFWQVISPFALVLVTAGVVAVVVSPLERRLQKFIRFRRLTALIMVGAVFLVVLFPLFIASILMVDQASGIIEASIGDGGWLSTFDVTSLVVFNVAPEIVQQEIMAIDISELGRGAAEWVLLNIGNIFASTARLVFGIFIFFIALYYMLYDRAKIYNEVLELSPFKDKLDADIVHRIVSTVRNVVFGALVVAVVQGIFAAIGMTIFGVPGALLWGALVIIAAQVPILGVGLVMIPAIVYLFVIGDTGSAIGLTIWSVIIVGLVDNFLSPLLIEGRTQMHALLILISILGGLQLFGSIGFIIGPTILAGVMVVLELYKSGILEGK
ncbi:MAG: AI-2E family transporter [bacterium]